MGRSRDRKKTEGRHIRLPHRVTVGAPLSFIDHHLASGDSLFGLWVRDAIDKAGKGGELLYVEELRNAERQAAVMQRIEALTDAEIAEARNSAEMWKDVEAQTGPLDNFVSFMHALDWLDLKQPIEKAAVRAWLDGQYGDPLLILAGRVEPAMKMRRGTLDKGRKLRDQQFDAEELLAALEAILDAARVLISEEHFLNWQITFPGVWTNWAGTAREGGFDAVVGNPPWDRVKLQQVEWFAARRPEIAKAQRASDRARMIKALETANDPLFADFRKAERRASDTLRIARKSGHYPLLSRGDINLYSLFVERAHGLVRPGGMVGLLTPSGIASDLSASPFFRGLATGGHLKSLSDFENRRSRYGLEPFFPDVDSRFKFAAMVSSPERTFDSAQCGFFLQSVNELKNSDQAFPVTAANFARVNPNTGTAPIFRTRRDMALTTAIYERLPVLVDRSGGETVAAWPVKYVRMFDMTNDSHQFRTRAELETSEGAWQIDGNRWQSKDGEWVPLYVGRMIHQFDHRAASVTVNEENLHNAALSGEVDAEMKIDPNFAPAPLYWLLAQDAMRGSAIAFRDIARATDARTMIAALLPNRAAGNTAPLILCDGSHLDQVMLVANANAIILDYIARQKTQSTHLNWYIVEQLPVVPQTAYDRLFGPKRAVDIVRESVLELTYTAHDMAPFARDIGHVDVAGAVLPPFIWNEERRLHLRAKLDALYFILYGVFDPTVIGFDPVQARDDISYIYSTFPIVERQEIAAWGRYRSRDLSLAYVNALLAGQPDAIIMG